MRGDKKVLLAAMLGATVMAAPAVSMAQARGETGWYAGITLGQSDVKNVDCTGFSCDTKDTAFRILGGYQINRNFAAELGYHDLGKVKVTGPANFDIKSNAWELVGVGAYPLANQFSVYGKLGVYRGEVKVPGSKATNTDLTYGIGGQYDLSREWGLRAEWQRYGKIGSDDVTGGKSDVDVLSIGAIWRFR